MTRYLEQANECTDPTTGDYLWIYNASAGATNKDQKVDISRFAIKANTGTFTSTQTFAPTSTTTEGIVVNMPTSTTYQAIKVNYNGTQRQQAYTDATTNRYVLYATDGGTGTGCYFVAERNNNGSTPAAGFFQSQNRAGTTYYQWVDASGNVRVGTTAPTNAQDGSGTVVGAQTSYVGIKEDIAEWNNSQAALDAILACRLFQYHLRGDEAKRQYTGLVITDDDRGAWFSENDADNQMPSLNERNLFGYLIGAMQALSAQVKALEAQVEELRNAH